MSCPETTEPSTLSHQKCRYNPVVFGDKWKKGQLNVLFGGLCLTCVSSLRMPSRRHAFIAKDTLQKRFTPQRPPYTVLHFAGSNLFSGWQHETHSSPVKIRTWYNVRLDTTWRPKDIYEATPYSSVSLFSRNVCVASMRFRRCIIFTWTINKAVDRSVVNILRLCCGLCFFTLEHRILPYTINHQTHTRSCQSQNSFRTRYLTVLLRRWTTK